MKQQAMTKTCSFAVVHMAVAFAVGYLMTGDIWVGSALALVEPACNTVAFYFHEKWWNRDKSGQAEAAGIQRVTARIVFSCSAAAATPRAPLPGRR